MSSLHRTLAGDVLVHHLTEDERTIDRDLLARHGRSARTLVKEGPLRLTMIALGPGGDLAAHSTTGPITIQVMEGEIAFNALGREYALTTGDILVLAPGVEHSARSATGGLFLLTVVHANSAGSRIANDGKNDSFHLIESPIWRQLDRWTNEGGRPDLTGGLDQRRATGGVAGATSLSPP